MKPARIFILSLALVAAHVFSDSSRAQTKLWTDGDAAQVDPELERLGRAFVRLAETVQPAVVQIRSYGETKTDKERPRSSRGSGFIIHPDGYVVTAYHVVDTAKTVEVRLPDKQRLAAKVLATEPQLDLALLKIEPPAKLAVLPFGDSSTLQVGQLIASVTYPFGSDSSLTLGIVSRYPKIEKDSFGYGFIQTDASVGPGASGGPLVDMRGHAVGMVTMASQTGNLGFAVPINVIKKMLPKLVNKEQVAWGWLGVKVAELTVERAADLGLWPVRGVIISDVLPGQPAWKSDLLAQDVVLAVDGVAVDSPREFIRLIGGTEAGKEVSLTIFRGGKLLSRSVLLGTKPTKSEEREG
ncbi:MAG TPA: trypsin-like peptidase domain-containing protein [Candidatus Acidoferrales bacterium]|nr:trypsin-like peptidase domain-containing protein [Candidatus Acidoferrales bacterium]